MSCQIMVGGDQGGGSPKADSPTSSDVPEHLFDHVEQSLQNGIKKGMLMEIMYKEPDKFWFITVNMVCGHLLRVRYTGSSEDFWCDLTKDNVQPFGWCREIEIKPLPPKEISNNIDELIPLLRSDISDPITVPKEALFDKGISAFEKIKTEMKVEVQSEKNPHEFWIATVVENIGGRLQLRYDSLTKTVDDFWLFYTSPRLRYIGFCADKGHPYQLQRPKNIVSEYNEYGFNVWDEHIQSSIAIDEQIPKSILTDEELSPHNFEEGMRMEAVNPANMREICPAYVSKVFDQNHFLVIVDNGYCQINHWICHSNFPYIFPVGWAETNGIDICPPQWKNKTAFDYKAYLESISSVIAPANCFKNNKNAFDEGFRPNMKLEAADPENPSKICVAQIVKVIDSLLLLKIEYTRKYYWFNCDSSDIFPTGWCSSHGIDVIDSPKDNFHYNEIPKSFGNGLPSQIEEEKCDRIYFNYKCYSGPCISKNKLSQLPKHVGPGPLSLVIREVLNMIISVAYKPGRLLKDWEWEGKVQPNMKLEVLKAKLKTNTHRANVQVVSTYEQVPSFCKEMCSKLQACPYLFGPTEITDQCPERCLLVNNKTKFRMLSFKGRKRRRRGTHFMTVRARERRAALEIENLSKDGVESGNESDQSLPSTSLHSESGTRPNTPDSNSDPSNKKSRKKREARVNVPPMKTRGAKLPNFALQIKQGHWNRKDVETIYNNTCVVPRKQYSDDSESDNSNSCNSNETKTNGEMEHISDVSDSEEPELKKLRVTPLHEPLRFDTKSIGYSDSSISLQSVNHCDVNLLLPPNPSTWSVDDLFNYLSRFEDCREIACKIKEEEIDGFAFIMLNLPTMREHLKLKSESALTLCKHVSTLKLTYFSHKC